MIYKASTEPQKHNCLFILAESSIAESLSRADALPEAGTVSSFHFFATVSLHCRTKLMIGVPPLMGRVLREKKTEAGPGETDRY